VSEVYPKANLKIGGIMIIQWEFQDPKMEVLYHIRPYFGGISPYIGLKNKPYIW
jgi:hypothetical protein